MTSVLARAYLYYGFPLHGNTIRMLEKRDAVRDLDHCPKCGQSGTTNYCPDDGVKLEHRMLPPGHKVLQTLREDKYCYHVENLVRYGCGCNATDDAHFLYLKDTLKKTKTQCEGFAPVNVSPIVCPSYIEFDKMFEDVCVHLEIPVTKPEFHIGLAWGVLDT